VLFAAAAMSYAIPGPQAGGIAGLIPQGFGHFPNAIRDFFEKMSPALGQTPLGVRSQQGMGNYGRVKTDWNLSDMQENVVTIMVNNVKELLSASEQETWYYRVCPVVTGVTSLRFRKMQTIFRPVIPQEAPPRTLPKQLEIQQVMGEDTISRYHSGFQLDDETLNAGVEKGLEWFAERVAMIEEGIVEGDKFFIITHIMNAHKHHRITDEQALQLIKGRGLEGHIDWEINMFGSLWKEKAPIEAWINAADVDFRTLGVRTSALVTIVHEHTLRLISQENAYYTTMSKGGNAQMLYDGPDGITSFRGGPVYTTRNFLGPNGQQMNPVGSVVEHGLYYHVRDPLNRKPDQRYSSDMRAVKITDVLNKGMATLNIINIAAATERWDVSGSGDLFSLVDNLGWARASADARKKVAKAADKDILHISLERVFGDDKDRTYAGPAKYWGSVKRTTVPTERVQSIATTALANIGAEDAALVERVIDEFLALVGEAENADLEEGGITAASLDALVGKPAVDYNGGDGCKPINDQLKHAQRDASTHFATALIGAQASRMPAGYGRLSAMRALYANRALVSTALYDRLAIVVPNADKVARLLMKGFQHSALLDKAYASSDMWYASAADMLFDHGILPQRAVLMVTTAGGRPAAARLGGDVAILGATELYQGMKQSYNAHNALVTKLPKLAVNVASRVPTTALSLFKAAMLLFAASMIEIKDAALAADPSTALNSLDGEVADDRVDVKKFSVDLLAKLKTFGAAKPTQLRRSAEEIKTELNAIVDAASRTLAAEAVEQAPVAQSNPVMTPLFLGPAQVVQLYRARAAGRLSEFTIGRDRSQDYPASLAELQSYAAALTGRVGASRPTFSSNLDFKRDLEGAKDLHAITNVAQLRAGFVAIGGSIPTAGVDSAPQPRLGRAVNAPSQARSTLARIAAARANPTPVQMGGSAGAADPTGMFRYFFKCIDHNIDLMVNSEFVARWREANVLASSNAELLVMRLWMTTPTNWHKSMAVWASSHIRLPIDFVLLRRLRVRTNAIIRMVPGAETMFLARGFEKTHFGTEQNTGVYGLTHQYYSGVVLLKEQNIQVYGGVDTHGYIGGMGPHFTDLSRVKFANDDTNVGQDIVSVAIPADLTLPLAWSPFGPISAEITAGATLGAVNDFSIDVETFESWRQDPRRGRSDGWRHPENLFGRPMAPLIGSYFTRDTTLVAGPEGNFKAHVPSGGLIPTEFATADLRKILDGKRVAPGAPLVLGANYILA